MTYTYESHYVNTETKRMSDEDWSDCFPGGYEWELKGATFKDYLAALLEHVAWDSCYEEWDTDPDTNTIRVCVVVDKHNHPASQRQIEEQVQGLRDDLYECEYTVCPTWVFRRDILDKEWKELE